MGVISGNFAPPPGREESVVDAEKELAKIEKLIFYIEIEGEEGGFLFIVRVRVRVATTFIITTAMRPTRLPRA